MKSRSLIARSRLTAVAVFCALAAACGGTTDPAKLTDQGYASLGKSDWKTAQVEFGKALQQLETTDEGFLRAKMGSIEALIYTDPSKAKDEFLGLAAGVSSKVKSADYIAVASKLAGKGEYGDAIAVLEGGLTAYPEDPKVRAVGERIKELASKAGDSEAIAKLKSLGYL